MHWRVRKKFAKVRAKRLWHNWFAWLPTRVPTRGRNSGQTMVWLATIRRKGVYINSGYGDYYWVWYYAFPNMDYKL